MRRAALLVEGVDLQPAVVVGETGCPHDGRDPGGCEVELRDRVGDAVGEWSQDVRLWLRGEVEAVALDVVVGLSQHGEIGCVAVLDVGAQVGGEGHGAGVECLRAPEKSDPVRGELPDVDGVPTARAADCDGHMLGARGRGRRVPLAENAQPPTEVASTVTTWRAIMRSDGEVRRAA